MKNAFMNCRAFTLEVGTHSGGHAGASPSLVCLAAQGDDALEVSCLREEVEGLDTFDLVSLF